MKFCRIAGAMAVAMLCGQYVFAQSTPLLRASDARDVSEEAKIFNPGQLRQLAAIRANAQVKRATVISLNGAAFDAGALSIAIPGNGTLELSRIKYVKRGGSSASWYGRTSSGGDAFFARHGDAVSGVIHDLGRTYELKSLGGKQQIWVEIDPAKLPSGHVDPGSGGKAGLKARSRTVSVAAQSASPLPAKTMAFGASALSSTPTVNVFVGYTSEAKAYLGDIDTAIQVAMDTFNQSFVNSQVNLNAVLVGTMQVALASDNVVNAANELPTLLHLKAARDRANADVVVVLNMLPGNICGAGGGTLTPPEFAFASVKASCLSGYTMSHEIGHLMGARHSHDFDQTTSTQFPNGYGYNHVPASNQCWHTIMAYPDYRAHPNTTCTSDPAINYWSNPNVLYNGVPTGIVNYADNASVLNQTGAIVAMNKNTKIAAKALSGINSVIRDVLIQP